MVPCNESNVDVKGSLNENTGNHSSAKLNRCRLCKKKTHPSNMCSGIWRTYILTNDARKRLLPLHKVFCFKCGRKGHFGDDCNDRKVSKIPKFEESAFSGNNLCDILKKEYFDLLELQERDRLLESVTDIGKNNLSYKKLLNDRISKRHRESSKTRRRKVSNFYRPTYQNK
ncbi:hypothetical protein NCAS_0E03560 [Naumovozyma castellii]|uniref:CCHC-type domain-containing protein n=1 Tax=Naumovozyma castellii TaxID=27288 RepID=G0VG07_NAUCA|nr:hypothetical protein NCAS_0E03560 [Naumovozyma castellii CBS 4309]CCC70426.1 hypothetical protein NCAS_0E03560 [Naumovozyma castellii CBS 4309]